MTDVNKIVGQKYGGFYYTDTLDGNAAVNNLICSKVVGTSEAELIDMRINEMRAQHIRSDLVIVRDTV